MNNVVIIKALCGLCAGGYNNPRPAVVWLRGPALMVLGRFTPWAAEPEAKPVAAKSAARLPRPGGELDAEEAFQQAYGFKSRDARYSSRADRRATARRPKYKK